MNWTMRLAIRFSLLTVLLFGTQFIFGVQRKPVPKSTGYINDYAQVLGSYEQQALEKKLSAYYDSTSTQIAVVIEQSLEGRDRFDRAMDFGRQWGIGTKGKNNGVLMYFAMDERKVFILTADKTQGGLPDGLTGSIIRKHIVPYFRQGQYAIGINNGIDQIIKALAGEFQADPSDGKSSGISPIIIFIVIIIIIIIIARNSKGGGGGYHRRGTYWFPTHTSGGGGSWTGGGGSSWGGFGGGGGFNGGGAGGSW